MAKAKSVPYRFIAPVGAPGETMYRWLLELLEAHHHDVVNARFALAWYLGWTSDEDGRLTLGQCKRSSDLEREIFDAAAFDFVILLNQDFWDDPIVTDTQRKALLDHELCHAAVKVDDNGSPIIDERGRVQYRLRKHDLEEFACIAERYGCWKRDLETFGLALSRARTADHWVGFSKLHDMLVAAGTPIPMNEIALWNERERREAHVWADAKRSAAPGLLIDASCPPHILSALSDRGSSPS